MYFSKLNFCYSIDAYNLSVEHELMIGKLQVIEILGLSFSVFYIEF